MTKFIKLTDATNVVFYQNLSFVESFTKGKDGSSELIFITNGDASVLCVKETPEEILALINQDNNSNSQYEITQDQQDMLSRSIL